MDFKTLSVAFVQWRALPEILSKPGALRPAFQFLADPSASYPPPDLPVLKTLGRVVPINSAALEDVPQTSKFWSMLQPQYPVQVVPSLGIQSTLPDVALRAIGLRVLIHPLGLITSFHAEIQADPPILGPTMAELLSKLEQGESLKSACQAMKNCTNVRKLFKRIADLLIPQILSVKPAELPRDVRTFRPFCVLMPHTGNFPGSEAELQAADDERLQLHAALERAAGTPPKGEVDRSDRYGLDAGRAWRTGVETGWIFSSMNGIAAHIRANDRAEALVERSRGCHFRNLATVISLYRLCYSFVGAAILSPNAVPPQHVRYGATILRAIQTEYPRWGIRWGMRKLTAHDAVNSFVDTALGAAKGVRDATQTKGRKRVFISYNHGDAKVALAVRDYLQADFDVMFDTYSMVPGEQIEQFIDRSIGAADAVISIVSSPSLLSSWVAYETVAAFEREKSRQAKLFLACTLTDDFFNPDFRLTCTKVIDTRIKQIEDLLPKYAEEKIDSVDLDEEKTRLYKLRNNLGNIIARLKSSLCLDIREPAFNESLKRLAETLAADKSPRSLPSP